MCIYEKFFNPIIVVTTSIVCPISQSSEALFIEVTPCPRNPPSHGGGISIKGWPWLDCRPKNLVRSCACDCCEWTTTCMGRMTSAQQHLFLKKVQKDMADVKGGLRHNAGGSSSPLNIRGLFFLVKNGIAMINLHIHQRRTKISYDRNDYHL